MQVWLVLLSLRLVLDANSDKLASMQSSLDMASRELDELKVVATDSRKALGLLADLELGSTVESVLRLREMNEGNTRSLDILSAGITRLDKDLLSSNADSLSIARRLDQVHREVSKQCLDWKESSAAAEDAVLKVRSVTTELANMSQSIAAVEDSCEKRFRRLEHDLNSRIATFADSQSKSLKDLHESVVGLGQARDSSPVLEYIVERTHSILADLKLTASVDRMRFRVLFSWHVQCLHAARRKLATDRIRDCVYRHLSSHVRDWKYLDGVARIRSSLDKAVARAVPDVELRIAALGIAESIEEMKCLIASQSSLIENLKLDGLQRDMDQKRILDQAFEQVKLELESRSADAHVAESERLLKLEEQIAALKSETRLHATELQSGERKEFAKILSSNADKIQSVQTDVLVMWNNVKQMDSIKADRKDLESEIRESISKYSDVRLLNFSERLEQLSDSIAPLLLIERKPNQSELKSVDTQTMESPKPVLTTSSGLFPHTGPTTTVGTDEITSAHNDAESGSTDRARRNPRGLSRASSRVHVASTKVTRPLPDHQIHARGINLTQSNVWPKRK